MNWIKTKLTVVGHYLLARLGEPSTYRGLIIFMSAGAWNRMDGSNKGELIMQLGLLAAGAIQALVPQSVLYRDKQP